MMGKRFVFSVVVTYGKRFHLLKQVVDACINEGIEKIIVVDNDSENREELKNLEKVLEGKLKGIYLNENTGSASGFKIGLEEACKDEKCQFILLLDDDNIPCSGSIQKALSIWNYCKETNDILALSFFRQADLHHLRAVKLGLRIKLHTNPFPWFNLKEMIAKRKMLNKYPIEALKKMKTVCPIIKVEMATYGGLFFHKTLIKKIGFPNPNFFIYYDDLDFTYRITKIGGAIFLCSELKIEDLDWPEWRTQNFNSTHYSFRENANELAIYYRARNRIFFEKKFIHNDFMSLLNLMSYLVYYFIVLSLSSITKVNPKLYKRRIKLLWKAVWDGYRGKMGRASFEGHEL